VCGQTSVLGLFYCEHPPEEHARAAVKEIMARYGPELRAAIAQALGQ